MLKLIKQRHAALTLVLMTLPVLASAESQSEWTESQLAAYTTVMDMAKHLAGLESFSVHVLAGYDALQADGQKIEFLDAREVTLKRPNQLRIEERTVDGDGQLVLFDGTELTIADRSAKVYAQAGQPGSIDDTLVYFVRDLQMPLPLAALFTTRFPAELESRLLVVDYVEHSNALGASAHQIAGRLANVDFQVWVTDGDRPLPLRIVLTYADEGRPQYRADLSNWNLKPKTSAKTFVFEASPDATRIPFAIQFADASLDEVQP